MMHGVMSSKCSTKLSNKDIDGHDFTRIAHPVLNSLVHGRALNHFIISSVNNFIDK